MKSSIHTLRFATILAAAALALSACGGGGGGGGSSSASSAPSAPTPASETSGASPALSGTLAPETHVGMFALLAAPGAAASAFAPTGDVVNDTMGFMNDKRAQLGLPAFTFKKEVAEAAQDHSKYDQLNGVVGHVETFGMPGFTGVLYTDRVNRYYTTASVGEITVGVWGAFASSTTGIDILFDAPFHRSVVLSDMNFAGPGVAASTSSSIGSEMTVDFADNKPFLPTLSLVAYPYSQQTGVKTSWVANEEPNPMMGNAAYINKVVGYPISLSSAELNMFTKTAFKITDPSGAVLPCQATDYGTDPADAKGLAICVPLSPLAPYTVYTVEATGTLQTTTIKGQFDVTWTFATGASTPNGI